MVKILALVLAGSSIKATNVALIDMYQPFAKPHYVDMPKSLSHPAAWPKSGDVGRAGLLASSGDASRVWIGRSIGYKGEHPYGIVWSPSGKYLATRWIPSNGKGLPTIRVFGRTGRLLVKVPSVDGVAYWGSKTDDLVMWRIGATGRGKRLVWKAGAIAAKPGVEATAMDSLYTRLKRVIAKAENSPVKDVPYQVLHDSSFNSVGGAVVYVRSVIRGDTPMPESFGRVYVVSLNLDWNAELAPDEGVLGVLADGWVCLNRRHVSEQVVLQRKNVRREVAISAQGQSRPPVFVH
jgi:hypothetical protein